MVDTKALSHCLWTGCCVRTQKSQKDDVTMQRNIEDFPYDLGVLATPYSWMVYLEYIWGLNGIHAS